MKTGKRKIIFLIGVCVLTICFVAWLRWRPAKRFSYSPPGSNELRVLTWNVGYFAPVKNKNLRDVDLEAISSILKRISPDVVVLQELSESSQAKIIAGSLGLEWSVHSAETGHGRQVIAILSPVDFTQTEKIECGGRITIGVSLFARNGDSVFVLGVHSPHPARGVQENADNIQCALSHAYDRNEKIRIIAGDINYNFDPEERDNELYLKIRRRFGDSTVGLGETYYAHTRIDHMFHYPKELEVVLKSSGLIDLPLRVAKVPGFRDHRPIAVTYNLAPD